MMEAIKENTRRRAKSQVDLAGKGVKMNQSTANFIDHFRALFTVSIKQRGIGLKS
jgi:hypothetical protein